MIFNLIGTFFKRSIAPIPLNLSSSPLLLSASSSSPSSIKLFSRTVPKKGLEEFFENGQAYPIYDQEKKVIYGRAWKAAELRNKSFEELHKLWFVLLKERNLLATQEAESKRLGQMFFGKHRDTKCKLSMARIKSVLTERQLIHNEAVKLVNQKESGQVSSESDLVLQENQREIYKRAEIKRKVRKGLNYMKRRQSLFT